MSSAVQFVRQSVVLQCRPEFRTAIRFNFCFTENTCVRFLLRENVGSMEASLCFDIFLPCVFHHQHSESFAKSFIDPLSIV